MKYYLVIFLFISFTALAENLRVLTVMEPPSSYISEQGVPTGYAVDIFNLLVKNTDFENDYTIEFVPEARVLNIADQKSNIVFFAFSRTALREDKYHWIGAVATKKWQAYALKHSNIHIDSIEQLKQFPMIGVVRGDVREEWLIDQGFVNLVSVTQHEQNVKLLLMGRLPIIAFENQGLTFITRKLNEDASVIKPIFTLNKANNYIAMSKNQTDMKMVKELKARYLAIKKNGALHALSVKWQSELENTYKIQSEIDGDLLSF